MAEISIIMASNRSKNFLGLLDNLEATAAVPSRLEVFIKIDEEDTKMQTELKGCEVGRPFKVTVFVSPRLNGIYSLHIGYRALFKLVPTDCYFIFNPSDEYRFLTKGWDDILLSYRHMYPDDIFRLKSSVNHNRAHNTFLECLPYPDNFPFYTRKWLELVEGFGNVEGPDTW